MTKDRIEIRMLTVPWYVYAKQDFNLNNIGDAMVESKVIKKGDVLFVCKATQNEDPGHLVFNLLRDLYCFWASSNDNIHMFLELKEKSDYRWKEDVAVLQDKKEEFALEIGSKG